MPYKHANYRGERRTKPEMQCIRDVADALDSTARFYRRSALRECDDYIEISCEKEALTGLIWDVASDYDVPVLPSKGMASLSAIHETVKTIENAWNVGKPTTIYLWRPRPNWRCYTCVYATAFCAVVRSS
jgi:hypothetical protein